MPISPDRIVNPLHDNLSFVVSAQLIPAIALLLIGGGVATSTPALGSVRRLGSEPVPAAAPPDGATAVNAAASA